MTFEIHRHPNWLVLRFGLQRMSEVDLNACRQTLVEELRLKPVSVLLCFHATTRPFSKTLALMILCKKVIERFGQRIAVVAPNIHFMKTLEQTGLERAFEFRSSETEVLGAPALAADRRTL